MRKLGFVILAAACCMVLTSAGASIGGGKDHEERIAQLIEGVRNCDQIQPEWLGAQELWEYDPVVCHDANRTKGFATESSPTFKLPASLRSIDDEAFEGTAIIHIDLPYTVESIGERAFADIPTLRIVKIPESTKQIASTAFSGNSRMTITGVPGSYARTWAKANGVLFTPILVVQAGTINVQITGGTNQRKETIDVDVTRSGELMEKRACWRPVSEITADQYEEFIANHLSGRAPPASV